MSDSMTFRRIARRVTQNAKRATAIINAQIQESISGIVVAKSFRQEQAIYETFDENNRQGYATGLQRGMTLMSIFPLMVFASGLGTAVLLFFGGVATRNPVAGISTGDWYLYMQAVGFYWWPMMSVASFWSQFQDGLAAAERVFALIDLEPKVKQTADDAPGQLDGRIDFQHVKFSYTDKEVVLPDFSLSIQPGETVALVGHTGAGKSSIAKLAMRFYEFQDGRINIDGRDIRTLDLDEYRSQTGFVPQEPFLFSGTLSENIAFGRPGATPEEIEEAARYISGGEWLATLPDGLDTDVGERGSSLSMGQRQLVALARVVLKNPAIFILDEATASIDPFTEWQIQQALNLIFNAHGLPQS